MLLFANDMCWLSHLHGVHNIIAISESLERPSKSLVSLHNISPTVLLRLASRLRLAVM